MGLVVMLSCVFVALGSSVKFSLGPEFLVSVDALSVGSGLLNVLNTLKYLVNTNCLIWIAYLELQETEHFLLQTII